MQSIRSALIIRWNTLKFGNIFVTQPQCIGHFGRISTWFFNKTWLHSAQLLNENKSNSSGCKKKGRWEKYWHITFLIYSKNSLLHLKPTMRNFTFAVFQWHFTSSLTILWFVTCLFDPLSFPMISYECTEWQSMDEANEKKKLKTPTLQQKHLPTLFRQKPLLVKRGCYFALWWS